MSGWTIDAELTCRRLEEPLISAYAFSMKSKWCPTRIILGYAFSGLLCNAAVDPAVLAEADALRASGNYEQAESGYRSLLVGIDVRQESSEEALILNRLGMVLLEESRYREAADSLARALSIRQLREGPASRDTLATTTNLASAYLAGGNLDAAVSSLMDVLDRGAQVLSRADLLLVRRNLAYAYLKRGDVGRAEPIVRRNLSEVQELFGPRDQNVAIEFNNMAEVLREQRQFYEAEQHLKSALAILETTGPHPIRLNCLRNLTALYIANRNYLRAEPVIRLTLELSEQLSGRQHPSLVPLLLTGARVNAVLGRIKESARLKARAFEIGRANNSPRP